MVKENRVGYFELAWDSESAGRGHALFLGALIFNEL